MENKALNMEQGINEIKTLAKELIKKAPVVIIGVTGGSCSGKGFLSQILGKMLKAKILSMDDYYVGIDNMKDDNYDSPDALDLELMKKHLALLKKNSKIEKPVYDFTTHKRTGYTGYKPSRVLLVEGLFTLSAILRDELDIAIFVDASENIRLKRRIERDIAERGRTKEGVLEQWNKTVSPMYKKYIEPQKKNADIVIINE